MQSAIAGPLSEKADGLDTGLKNLNENGCRLQESNPRPTVYKTAALPTELSRPGNWPGLSAYLMRRSVGLPPPEGFFGGSGVVGAGSATGGLEATETDSVSPLICTAGFAPSTSKVIPWPVSRALSAYTLVMG